MEPPQEDLFVPSRFDPTEEQLAIQRSHDAHLIVEAAAGAAKTTTLALRVAQALQRGASASSVLVLTYTQPAVQALHGKLQLVGVSAGVRAKLRIRTFEDFAREVLRDHERSNVPVYDRAELLRPFVLTAIDRVRRNPDGRGFDEYQFEGSGDAAVEGYLSEFFHLKGTMQLVLEGDGRRVTPTLAADLGRDYAMLRVLIAYERERRGGHPDHPRFRAIGDATYDLARLLMSEDEPELRTQLLAKSFEFVALDEMHDLNRAMFTVLRAVLDANRRAGFVGVGDRDQVIHALAGARAEFMGEAFDREVARAKRLPLSASYRFGSNLAKAAGRVSRKPYASRAQRKTTIDARRCDSRPSACKAIVDAAIERQASSPKAAMGEFAVLLRHAHQSIGIENLLIESHIPYVTQGMESYLFRPEVLLVRALLAYAMDDFGSIQSMPTRREAARALLLFGGGVLDVGDGDGGSKGAEQHELQREALDSVADNPRLLTVFFENQVMRNGTPQARALMTAAVEAARVHAATGAGGDALRSVIDALQPQVLAARALVSSARVRQVRANLDGLVASAAAYERVGDFFMALNGFEVRRSELAVTKSLVLSTIEAAKGLEYEHVVMPFMNEHEFSAGGEVDDRNLFYVGITRAKSRLTLLWDVERPSRHLVDAGLVARFTPTSP